MIVVSPYQLQLWKAVCNKHNLLHHISSPELTYALLYILFFIVSPPIDLIYINGTIQLCEPIYPHGIILTYQVVAKNNHSDTISGSLNTTALNISISMLCTEPGTYLVKVCSVV